MDVISIYNAALSAIGTKSKFQTVNDAGVEMETCNLWYDTVRQHVLRAAHWTSIGGVAKLVAAVTRDPEEDWVVTDPPPGYLYSYTPPVDVLIPWYMSDFSPFLVGQSSSNDKRIYSNQETAILYYGKDQTATAKFDANLTMCVIYALAAHIAVKLTGKVDRGKLNQELANDLIMSARLVDANTGDNLLPDWVAPWHAARGVPSVSETRYIFPYGPLINVAWF